MIGLPMIMCIVHASGCCACLIVNLIVDSIFFMYIFVFDHFRSSLLKLEGTMLFGFSGALVISQMMTLSHFLREQR